MKLTFLGGADEIGASSALVEIAGRRLLIDCGIRMSPRQGEVLPWLARVEEGGGVDAIIQTHAHMDHSGALPVAYASFKAPLYMTPPTLSIITTLLYDALKIMENEKAEGELPMYSPPMVEAVIGATRTVPFMRPVWLSDDLCLTFHPAGHILGASSVILESPEGSVMFSGDICAAEQRTVPGLVLPAVRPDVVVIESTYGNRNHASRTMEEQRLISQVAEVVQRKGAVLVPAFAIGRAQEVILSLSRAIESGEILPVPIYVDGMVRQVCSIYASYPEYVSRWLQIRMQRKGNPFFYKGGPAIAVANPREREKVAATRPCIIVSSSGMLSGGPSVYYASQLASDPNSLIAITGYQDEESPGRRLQEVAAAGGGEAMMGDRPVNFQCKVATYSLSAHSDASQIVAEVEALRPKEVVLVHGYEQAKSALIEKLEAHNFSVIHCPKLGETLSIDPKQRRVQRPKEEPRAETRPLTHEERTWIASRLLARDSTGRIYTIQELLEAWGYPVEASTKEEAARLAELLEEKGSPFKRDGTRPFLYKLRTSKIATEDGAPKGLLDNQQEITDLIDQIFPASMGLYRRGLYLDRKTVILSFHFPKVTSKTHAAQLEELQAKILWRVEVNPETHQQALIDVATRLIPKEWGIKKRPAIHAAHNTLAVQMESLGSLEEVTSISRAFHEATGFRLDLISGAGLKVTKTSVTAAEPSGVYMEINATYQRIKEAFAGAPHKPLKVGLKNAPSKHIELAFLSPEIGARYQATLQKLREETGWELRVKPHADQHKLKELAKELLADCKPLKEPSFLASTSSIEVKVGLSPSEEERARIQAAFLELTGCGLIIV